MSDITKLSDAFVDEYAAALPELATLDGIADHDDKLRDWSLVGLDAQRDMYRRGRQRALEIEADGKWDQLAHQVFLDEMNRQLAFYDSDEPLRDLNHIYSGLQQIRDAFDVMGTDTEDDWVRIISRLNALPAALDGYARRLEEGRRRGITAPLRQVRAAAEQAATHGSPESGLLEFERVLAQREQAATLNRALSEALTRGMDAFTRLADYLEETYAPEADPTDGMGWDRYQLGLRRWLGGTIDPQSTYEWGWSEIRRLWDEMSHVADEIESGASIPEALAILKTDPARVAHSPGEFLEIMNARQHQALADLNGAHFDVPEEIQTINVKFGPPGSSLGAWYTPPTEDFSRPGEVWYAFPPEQTTYPLYDEITTVYHEGFPGHHLQSGLVACYSDLLTRFHRKVVWMSGSGEGWALYAEQLMRDLGYLEKPDYVMGLLASQMFRSCRIAVDIGFHLGLPIPSDTTGLDLGDRWTFESATKLMRERAFLPAPNAESEVTRYLGWPGQAISYKVGEQTIIDLRREVERREGASFDLKAFHRRVLEAGAVGLDLLRTVVLDSTTDDRRQTTDFR